MSAPVRDALMERLRQEGTVALVGSDLSTTMRAVVRELEADGRVRVSVRDVLTGEGKSRGMVSRWLVRLLDQ